MPRRIVFSKIGIIIIRNLKYNKMLLLQHTKEIASAFDEKFY